MIRNLTAITLGMTLVASATMMSFSDASRDTYHAYLTGKQKSTKSYRNFANGRSYKVQNRVQRNERHTKGSNPTRNLRFSQSDTRNTYSRKDTASNLKLRPSTNPQRTAWQSPLKREAITVGNLDGQRLLLRTYVNDTFSVQIPLDWKNSEADNHTFTNRSGDMTARVTRINGDSCSNPSAFKTCAIAIAKTQNERAIPGYGKILTASKVVRQYQSTDAFLNRPDLTTPTYTESFSASFPSKGQTLITRYIVRDLDGGVYAIELQSSLAKAAAHIGIAKRVFDSFRIYPTN